MAFFPCIRFCDLSTLNMRFETRYNAVKDKRKAYEGIIKLHNERDYFFCLLQKMFCVADTRGLRLVFENPYNAETYLKSVLRRPNVLDHNRMLRGDYFVKPTAYWFINCEPTNGQTIQKDKEQHLVWGKNKKAIESAKIRGIEHIAKGSTQTGLCSEERSMISPDYARNFICDFLLGKAQENTQLSLFE